MKLARSRRVEYPCGVVVLRADVTREDCGQQCNSLIVRCQRKARVRREGGINAAWFNYQPHQPSCLSRNLGVGVVDTKRASAYCASCYGDSAVVSRLNPGVSDTGLCNVFSEANKRADT